MKWAENWFASGNQQMLLSSPWVRWALELCRREQREDYLFDNTHLDQLRHIVKLDLEKLVRKLQWFIWKNFFFLKKKVNINIAFLSRSICLSHRHRGSCGWMQIWCIVLESQSHFLMLNISRKRVIRKFLNGNPKKSILITRYFAIWIYALVIAVN